MRPLSEGQLAARAGYIEIVTEETGYDDDELYPGSFEWWLHGRSGVTIAVRLEDSGVVSGAARPIKESELRAGTTAMGFEWEEAPELREWVNRHQSEFSKSTAPRRIGAQRPDIADDIEALSAS